MDPPVPAAQGKGSWAGSPGVALPGAPDRWAGCTGGCGAAWGWSSGALPGGVLACGCPVRTGLGSPWPLLLPAASPSSICSASALSRARPAPAGRVQLPGLWGPRGRSPPVPFPLLSPSLEGPRPGMSTGTPSGRGAPSPQSPGSPVPQGSAGPHACRTAGHQAGDRGARTRPSRRVWPAGDPRALSRSAAPQCCSGLAPVPFALRPGADAVAVQRLRGRPGFGTSGGSGCLLLR